MPVIPVHIDTDIGGDTDDLCALAMVLGWPGAELVAVTTSADPNGTRAGLAAFALSLAERSEVPLAAGAGGFVSRPGSDPGPIDTARFWPEPINPVASAPGEALDLLSASIERGATVVALGPFTNLALLETAKPGLLAKTPVVVMGGYEGPPPAGFPRWGPEMDWNVQQDPEAALIVFERCDPIVVTLAVTVQTALPEQDLDVLRQGGPLARLIAHQAKFYGSEHDNRSLGAAHSGLPDDLLNFQHDPLACAVALGWEGVRIERRPLRAKLKDGLLTLAADGSLGGLRVVTSVDYRRFRTVWLEAVAGLDG